VRFTGVVEVAAVMVKGVGRKASGVALFVMGLGAGLLGWGGSGGVVLFGAAGTWWDVF
jgi:hypothetical protein